MAILTLISDVIYDYNLVLWYNDWYENDYRRIWVPCWLILYKDYGFYDTSQSPLLNLTEAWRLQKNKTRTTSCYNISIAMA